MSGATETIAQQGKGISNDLSNDTASLEQKKTGTSTPPRITSPGMF